MSGVSLSLGHGLARFGVLWMGRVWQLGGWGGQVFGRRSLPGAAILLGVLIQSSPIKRHWPGQAESSVDAAE